VETAVIGIIGAVVGILLSNVLRLYLDWRNRLERIRDIQTALQAEIRSHRETLEEYGDAGFAEAMTRRLSEEAGYVPLVTRKGDAQIFAAIVSDIHILPASVIDPVVVYYRQWRSIGAFVEDLRSDAFGSLPPTRKVEAFKDYLDVGAYAVELADAALAAIAVSLRPGRAA
jgi:hypothetical protein